MSAFRFFGGVLSGRHLQFPMSNIQGSKMDERVAKLRNAKEAESFAANAERLGRPDLAEEARSRGHELKAAERKSRPKSEGQAPRKDKRVSLTPRAALPDESLFLNGVFESVLVEIEEAQVANPDLVCYLQPYKPALIRRLHEAPPTASDPWRLFMSVTSSLSVVSYEADIVECHDKRALTGDQVARLNHHFVEYQPNERGVHLSIDGQEAGSNLLGIVRLKRIEPPLDVAGFRKLSDNESLAQRTRAGGWSYVRAPEIREPYELLSEKAWNDLTQHDAARTVRSSRKERLERLASADPMPPTMYVVVKMYRRNQDVIAEVLARAAGLCEACLVPAPFVRAKDGTPFLEVHHKIRLADAGHDTVENAIALCPNCHRKQHFGAIETS